MLLNPCKYSFKDLLDQTTDTITIIELYSLTQAERNQKVKDLCNKAKWYWEDQRGSDGVIYTAFSPLKIARNKNDSI